MNLSNQAPSGEEGSQGPDGTLNPEILQILSGLKLLGSGYQSDAHTLPFEIITLFGGLKIITDEILEKLGIEKTFELRAMTPMNDGSTYIGIFTYKNNTISLNWHPERGWILPSGGLPEKIPAQKIQTSIEYFKGRLCSLLAPGPFLNGGRIGDWYETNEFHKFSPGDILVLKDENEFSFGHRAIAIVKYYGMEEYLGRKVGRYVVQMEYDTAGKGVIDWIPREIQMQKHTKGDIEAHFRRVKAKSVKEALQAYT